MLLAHWWLWKVTVKVLVIQSCLTLCDPMDSSLAGSFVHGILQARILEWVAISFSRESSQSKDQSWVSCIADRFFTIWTTGEALCWWWGASFPQAPSFQCGRISMRTKLVFYSKLWWDIPEYFIPSSPRVLQSEWWLWKEEFWVCSLVIYFSMAFPTESTHDLPFQTLPYWRSLLPSPLPVTVKFGNPVLGSSWLVNT